jgi:hypothetical protein
MNAEIRSIENPPKMAKEARAKNALRVSLDGMPTAGAGAVY